MTARELADLREASGQKRIQKSDVPQASHDALVRDFNGQPFPKKSNKLDVQRTSTTGYVLFEKVQALKALSPKKSKYKAVRCVDADGNKFDSKAELARWVVLKLLEKNGTIVNLERQYRFPIVIRGIKCGTYVADFKYDVPDVRESTIRPVVEDVKSEPTKTPVYRLKKKLVEAQYGIKITEIT